MTQAKPRFKSIEEYLNYDDGTDKKPKEYAARGIPEFLQFDPDRAVVTVLTLTDGAYRLRKFRPVVSPTFPDRQLTVEQILRAGR